VPGQVAFRSQGRRRRASAVRGGRHDRRRGRPDANQRPVERYRYQVRRSWRAWPRPFDRLDPHEPCRPDHASLDNARPQGARAQGQAARDRPGHLCPPSKTRSILASSALKRPEESSSGSPMILSAGSASRLEAGACRFGGHPLIVLLAQPLVSARIPLTRAEPQQPGHDALDRSRVAQKRRAVRAPSVPGSIHGSACQ